MELILICSGVVLVSILTISMYWLSSFKSYADPGLPPGKTGLPLIGESAEFISNLQNGNLENFNFKRMLKYNNHNVFKTSVLGDHMAVMCGAQGSKFFFFTANNLVKRWLPRPAQRTAFPPELEVMVDQYLKPAFHVAAIKFNILKTYLPLMDAMAQYHLDSKWHPLQVIKVYPSVKKYTFALACRLLLSIEDPEAVESLYGPMETWSSGLYALPINLPGTQMNRSLKAGTFLRSHLQQIVRQRRSSMESSPKDNLLSYFIQGCEDDKVVIDGSMLTLLASHDTITSVITMILKVISPNGDHPEVYRRVYQENMKIGTPGNLLSLKDTRKMRFTWNVAREVMRIYSAAAFLTREATTDFTYAGHHIPKGYKLMKNILAIHMDPKYFPEPEKFDPSRFDGEGPLPYTYMPFGGGSFKCLGGNYARLVILVFIHNVVKRFKWKTIIPDEKIIRSPVPKPSQGFPIIIYSALD